MKAKIKAALNQLDVIHNDVLKMHNKEEEWLTAQGWTRSVSPSGMGLWTKTIRASCYAKIHRQGALNMERHLLINELREIEDAKLGGVI